MSTFKGGRSEADRLGDVVAARSKLHRMAVMALGAATIIGLGVGLIPGLPLWVGLALGGIGAAAIGLKTMSFRSDQATDRRRIAELGGGGGSQATARATPQGVPERAVPLKTAVDAALTRLEATVGELTDDNPEIRTAISEARQQADKLLASLIKLDGILAQQDLAGLRAKQAQLAAQADAAPGDTVMVERLEAVSEQVASVAEIETRVEQVEARLSLLAEQIDSLRLQVSAAGTDGEASKLEQALRSLQTEVRTGQELAELDVSRLSRAVER